MVACLNVVQLNVYRGSHWGRSSISHLEFTFTSGGLGSASMFRPLRIEYENDLHPVISPGDNRRRIVRDNVGRKQRMTWLERLMGALGWKLLRVGGWQDWARECCGGVVVRGSLFLPWKGTGRCVGIPKFIAFADSLGPGRRLAEAGPRSKGSARAVGEWLGCGSWGMKLRPQWFPED